MINNLKTFPGHSLSNVLIPISYVSNFNIYAENHQTGIKFTAVEMRGCVEYVSFISTGYFFYLCLIYSDLFP